MDYEPTHRKATIDDLPKIIELLIDDEIGKTRESSNEKSYQRYAETFQKIDTDPNHYLMVVELEKEIVGTCHLTILPVLISGGTSRLQIEAVRVATKYRGSGIGQWMFEAAFDYGKSRGASLSQLTTDKRRARAKEFYERLGFEATHEGMKKKF